VFGKLKQVTVQCYVMSSEGIKKYCFLCIIPCHSKEKSLNGMQTYQIVHTKLSYKSMNLKKKRMKVLIDSWL
jgi:hypothetical protein